MLRTRLTLKPGAPGTKKLVAEYGSRLVCVRYRYDQSSGRRFKTVEVIIEDRPWTPCPEPFEYVHVAVPNKPGRTRTAIKRLGGTWHAQTRTWRITYAAARLLKLTKHLLTVDGYTGGEFSLYQ